MKLETIILAALVGTGICGNAQPAPQTNVPMSKAALVQCANAGVAECQYELGKLVEEGRTVAKDLAAAKQLYTLAYQNGYDPAGAAMLRLTRSQTPLATGEKTSSDGSALAKSDAVLSPVFVAAVPTTLPPAAAALRTSSPASWGMTAEKGSAPTVANISLGESEREFVSKVDNANCQDKDTPPVSRECNATIGNGKVDVSGDFLHNELVSMEFNSAVAPVECKYLIDELSSILGRTNHGLASHFLSMLIPGGSGKFWTGKTWAVVSGCESPKGAAPEAMLIVMRNDAAKLSQ